MRCASESSLTIRELLVGHVYPNVGKKCEWMDGRAILAPTNQQVDQLNNLITDQFPGEPIVLTSSDEVVNPDDFQRYNSEYLNSLSPNGLPITDFSSRQACH